MGGVGGIWVEMNQSLYAHMNNKTKMKKKKKEMFNFLEDVKPSVDNKNVKVN
jgi:hypothetical protein